MIVVSLFQNPLEGFFGKIKNNTSLQIIVLFRLLVSHFTFLCISLHQKGTTMLSTKVLGGKAHFSFRHRLLNSILALGLFLSLLGAAANSLMHRPWPSVAASLFAFVYLTALYYLSRIRRLYTFPVVAAFGLCLFILPAAWIYTDGSLGRVPYYLLLFIPMISILLENAKKWLAIGTFILLINGLIYWEFHHPPVADEFFASASRYMDLSFTLTLAILASATMTGVIFGHYTKEALRAKTFLFKTHQAQKSYKYLCYHDKLTNTNNRNCFDDDVLRVENGPEKQMGVFFFDVDGLKFVNDTLGLESGNKLLQQAAIFLRSFFSKEHPIYRIGGDEFVILLKNADEPALENLYATIRNHVDELNHQNHGTSLPLNLSFAYSIGPSQNVRILLKEAEGKMFREKLLRTTGDAGTIMQTVRQMLAARDFGTGEHSERLEPLIVEFAERAGIAPSSMADLKLFAKFHDIGKIGIPDHILLKPAALTTEERHLMEKHCEIGCRIAHASHDLLPIANLILKHHEWWNGRGYPLRLAGESIPVECRLVAIADSYDAMINDRPYRKGMSSQAALEELHRCSGSQFDPKLTEIFIAMIHQLGQSKNLDIPHEAKALATYEEQALNLHTL